MIEFTYTDNSEEVAQSLAAFQSALADNEFAFREVADDFRQMMTAQFASEGRVGGTPWVARKIPAGADLARSARSAKFARRRAAASAPATRGRALLEAPLLVRTGALRDSLSRPGGENVEEIDDGSLLLGTRVPYAGFHQFGTRQMPARPLIVLTDERTQRWTEFVQSAIEENTPLLGANELR